MPGFQYVFGSSVCFTSVAMFGACASIEALVTWGSCALNNNTKALAFTMTASMLSISNNYISIFGRKDSLKCSNIYYLFF